MGAGARLGVRAQRWSLPPAHRRAAPQARRSPGKESVRLAGLGHLYAGRQVAGAITRVWWPLAALVAIFVPRAAAVAGSSVRAAGSRLVEDGAPTTPQYVALRVADDVAYGTGVWMGAPMNGDWAP